MNGKSYNERGTLINAEKLKQKVMQKANAARRKWSGTVYQDERYMAFLEVAKMIDECKVTYPHKRTVKKRAEPNYMAYKYK